MKIGIVTIYKGFNCGAYLQSYALCEYLTQQGHQVKFIKHKARRPFISMVKAVLKRILLFKFREVSFWIRFYVKLQKLHRKIEICSIKDAEKFDLVIYGSDEMWNIRRKENYSNPILFGKYIHNVNKIAYAASVNGSLTSDFMKNDEVLNLINTFRGLSARDIDSQKILEEVSTMPVELVVDPTLLLDKQFYIDKEDKVVLPSEFILLYLYQRNLTEKGMKKRIIDFSKEKGIPIVSVCNPFCWCDISIGMSPFEMLYAFHKASYVITNTFHGIMFSAIFEKNIIISGIHNKKVEEAVKLFGYQERVVGADGAKITDISNVMPDYHVIEKSVKVWRQESIAYLKKYIH